MKALDALKASPPEVRAAALAVVDQVSAPLTKRQLAGAFRAHGIGLLDAKRKARALRKLDIIAVAPRGPCSSSIVGFGLARTRPVGLHSKSRQEPIARR